MTSIDRLIRDEHNALSYTSRNQVALEGAALRGELGVETQLRAMSAQALAMRATGDEAGYQAIKAAALKIYEGATS